MLSPLVIRLLQSQGGVSGSGSFGETTCEGRVAVFNPARG